MVLLAKPTHPTRRIHGGDGIATVVDATEGNGSMTIHWVNGNPQTSAFNLDLHTSLDGWFDIIPDEEHDKYLPEGYELPTNDPMAMFQMLAADIMGAKK